MRPGAAKARSPAAFFLILLLASQVALETAACRYTPRLHHAGRALRQSSLDPDQVTSSVEAVGSTADAINSVLKSTKDAADAASQTAKAIGALSKLSVAASFLGPVLDMAFSFALGDPTEDLIREEFAKVNEKLDMLAGKIDDLGDDIKGAIAEAFSLQDYNALSSSVRAVSDKVKEFLSSPDNQEVRDGAKFTCNDENMEKVLVTLKELITCSGLSNCLSDALKRKAEYEQIRYFEMARLVVRDASLALQMSEACSVIQGVPDATKATRKQDGVNNLNSIAERVQADYNALEKEFWDIAINDRIVKPMNDRTEEANEVIAEGIWRDLTARYPFMYWAVAVYDEAWESDNHLTSACPDAACARGNEIGGYFAFRIGENKKSVGVQYRHKKFSEDESAQAKLESYITDCKDNDRGDSVESLFPCLTERDDVFSVLIVDHGYGLRSYMDKSTESGLAFYNDEDEGQSINANIGTGGKDLWSQTPLEIPDPNATPTDESTPSPDSCTPNLVDTDLNGGDLYDGFTTESAEECCQSCKEADECWAFTWNSQNGMCFHKAQTGWEQVEYVGAFSDYFTDDSAPSPSSCPAALVDTDLNGGDLYDGFTTESAEECCQSCKETDECRAFTWNSQNGMCFHKAQTGWEQVEYVGAFSNVFYDFSNMF